MSDRVLFRQIVVVNLGKLSAVFPQLFAVAATLKFIDYNVAMTFILLIIIIIYYLLTTDKLLLSICINLSVLLFALSAWYVLELILNY